MTIPFTKLFASITESTIWSEPDRTRIVWITMLAMCDSHGRVWASVPGLARRAVVPVEDTRIALGSFLAPDEESRTKDHDGRRITAIDGGWQILNYQKYRELRDDDTRREQTAARVRKYRETHRKINTVTQDVTQKIKCNANEEVEGEVEREGEKTKNKHTVSIPPDLAPNGPEIASWMAYKRQKGQSYKSRGLEALWSRIRKIPAPNRAAAIEYSMANNWAGIFEPKGGTVGTKTPKPGEPGFTPGPMDYVILAYRDAMDVPESEKRIWSNTYWEDCKRDAQAILEFFQGDWKRARECVEYYVRDFRGKGLSVTLATVKKHAADYKYGRRG